MKNSLEKQRVVAVIHGSDSDLPQMLKGLDLLNTCDRDSVLVNGIYCCSVHNNPMELFGLLAQLINEGVEYIIAGAGWANHLTGMTDRILRNVFKDSHIKVIGSAFEDTENAIHTQAAILSITEMPGSCVTFNNYVGETGFEEAVKLVIGGNDSDFREVIVKKPKLATCRSLELAIQEAELMALAMNLKLIKE